MKRQQWSLPLVALPPVLRGAAALVLAWLTAASTSAAVVPPSASAVEGIGFDETLPSTGGLTSQQFFRPADLSEIPPGTLIYGLSLRLDAVHGTSHPASYPQTSFTWTRFDIKMGEGKLAFDLTNEFASNYIGAPTQVRTGPLTMGVDFFPGTGAPHAWSSLIEFDAPYLYTGGTLALEVRNDGPAQTPLIIDAVGGPADANGGFIHYNFGNDNAGFANSVFAQANWVISLRTEPVPEVGDLNGDGWVDIFDVGIVSDNWDETGPAGIPGDANFDGSVDIFDVGTVSDHWNPNPGGTSVPEPSALVLAALGLLVGIAARSRASRSAAL